MNTIDDILKDNRVCPKPAFWNEVWKELQSNSEETILKPLILSAWNFSSDNEKRLRFKYHLEKAVELNVIEKIKTIVGNIDDNWHCSYE